MLFPAPRGRYGKSFGVFVDSEFQRLDQDHNGSVSVSEFRACYGRFHLLYRSQQSRLNGSQEAAGASGPLAGTTTTTTPASAGGVGKFAYDLPQWMRDQSVAATSSVWGAFQRGQVMQTVNPPVNWFSYVLRNFETTAASQNDHGDDDDDDHDHDPSSLMSLYGFDVSASQRPWFGTGPYAFYCVVFYVLENWRNHHGKAFLTFFVVFAHGSICVCDQVEEVSGFADPVVASGESQPSSSDSGAIDSNGRLLVVNEADGRPMSPTPLKNKTFVCHVCRVVEVIFCSAVHAWIVKQRCPRCDAMNFRSSLVLALRYLRISQVAGAEREPGRLDRLRVGDIVMTFFGRDNEQCLRSRSAFVDLAGKLPFV